LGLEAPFERVSAVKSPYATTLLVGLLPAQVGCGAVASQAGDTRTDAGTVHDASKDAGDSGTGVDVDVPDTGDDVTSPPVGLTGAGVADPAGLAVDDTSVYWYSTNAVFKVDKAGGLAVTLAMATTPSAIAIDSRSVYYAQYGAIMGIPLGGGTPVTVASAGVTDALSVDASRLYWANNTGSIEAAPIAGGAAVQLAFGSCYPSRAAIDPQFVYWMDCDISRAPLSGGGPTVKLTTSGNLEGGRIAVDTTGIYFAALGGTTAGVYSVPLNGGPVRQLAQATTVSGLALDAKNVYFADQTQGTVGYVPKGGGSAVVLATGQARPRGLAVDASYVYFGTDEAIVRARKL
jgi:hypothetical protein